MRSGGQTNNTESQVIENKSSLISMELDDNEQNSSLHTACIWTIVGLILLAVLLKSAIMFYCCKRKMNEREVKKEK